MNALTRFALLRHAQTEWNRDKRIQGQTDTRLTPEGEAQAAAWGPALESLGLQRILCSDLTRARRTAELVNQTLGLPVESDPGLREQDWGDWVGRSIAELRGELGPEVRRQEELGWEFRPPGGESRLEVLARARDAIEAAAERHPGQNILVVTHRGVIKCLSYQLLGSDFSPDEPDPLKKNRLHWLRRDHSGLAVERLNHDPRESI